MPREIWPLYHRARNPSGIFGLSFLEYIFPSKNWPPRVGRQDRTQSFINKSSNLSEGRWAAANQAVVNESFKDPAGGGVGDTCGHELSVRW